MMTCFKELRCPSTPPHQQQLFSLSPPDLPVSEVISRVSKNSKGRLCLLGIRKGFWLNGLTRTGRRLGRLRNCWLEFVLGQSIEESKSEFMTSAECVQREPRQVQHCHY